MHDTIDRINLGTMRTAAAVAQYSFRDDLYPHERLALDLVADEVRDRPILDIGVGAGRTVRALCDLSEDYIGVDYSAEMIAACRSRHPGVRFEHADARDLSFIDDDSIALAVFSCNGLSMVGHADRLLILRQVRRVLRPGGVFIFTTYNLNSPEARAGFRFPDFQPSLNPARLAVRGARWLRSTAESIGNRRRYRAHEERAADYAVINDRCHNYGVMLYYLTLAGQRRQLEAEGFEPGADAYERSGRLITDDTVQDSMLFVARKA